PPVASASATDVMTRAYSIQPRSGSGADDPRAGAQIVQAAAVLVEEHGDEAEAGRQRQQSPDNRPNHRVTEIDRAARFARNHANAGNQLAHSLAAGGKC